MSVYVKAAAGCILFLVGGATTATTTAESTGGATDVQLCGSVAYDPKRYYCQHGTYTLHNSATLVKTVDMKCCNVGYFR